MPVKENEGEKDTKEDKGSEKLPFTPGIEKAMCML